MLGRGNVPEGPEDDPRLGVARAGLFLEDPEEHYHPGG